MNLIDGPGEGSPRYAAWIRPLCSQRLYPWTRSVLSVRCFSPGDGRSGLCLPKSDRPAKANSTLKILIHAHHAFVLALQYLIRGQFPVAKVVVGLGG